jgi:peptidoglycan/xylan/chitin deacetylase (PgdA/CDA1 family)
VQHGRRPLLPRARQPRRRQPRRRQPRRLLPRHSRQSPPCANPDAIGISRVVEIDTTGGPGFGFEHFKQLDFLRDKEVVLTFDDGPWPVNTPSVLKTLAEECTTGIFFPIGKHATYYPEILKQVLAAVEDKVIDFSARVLHCERHRHP